MYLGGLNVTTLCLYRVGVKPGLWTNGLDSGLNSGLLFWTVCACMRYCAYTEAEGGHPISNFHFPNSNEYTEIHMFPGITQTC